MADTGKILVFYRETKVVCLDEDVEIVSETPEGVAVRHTYRKGTRLEFIPREKLEGIVYEDIKPDRKPRKAKEAKPTPEPVEKPTPEPAAAEPVVTEEDAGENIFSESDDFDDDGDDFDNDEFE
jgi:hypothetical protein